MKRLLVNYMLLLTTVAGLIACNAQADNRPEPKENTLKNTIRQFSKDPELKNAGIGFIAVDANSGEIVADWHPDMSLAPASTQKLISTATALEILGPDYRFETILEYDGTISNGTLNGNIYIRGGGDPTLGSPRFAAHYSGFLDRWVAAVKSLGISQINGYVVGDAQIYSTQIVPDRFCWMDMGNYYSLGACGLSIYDNTFRLSFRSPAHVGGLTQVIKVEPEIPGLTFDNYVTAAANSRDEAYIFGAPYTYDWSIRGTIPAGRSEFTIKGALPDPPHFAALEFERSLKAAGVAVSRPATTIRRMRLARQMPNTERQKFHTTQSPALKDIIYRTNLWSVNHYAEHLFTHIGVARLAEGDVEHGEAAIKQFWASKGMDTAGMYLFDGSGLSRNDQITPRQLAYLLTYMKRKGRYFDAFYASLPIAGKSGTLGHMCRGTRAQNNLRAKSGSIRKVRAYAGYVTTSAGRELAFSICVNTYNCSDSEMRQKLETLLVAMANLNY